MYVNDWSTIKCDHSDTAIHRTSEHCTQIIPSFYRWDNIQNISSFRILNKLTNFAAEPPHLCVELIISQTNKNYSIHNLQH